MEKSAEIVGVYLFDSRNLCHLIEMRLKGWDVDTFIGGITQADSSLAQENWQVPWDERIMEAEGDEATVVFFFHFLKVGQPLDTPAGPLQLPQAGSLPDRLSHVEYEQP